jgi:hypothetical protein
MYDSVREHYFFTLEQKGQIESRLNGRIGVFVLVATALGFYVRSYNFWLLSSWWDGWMLITFVGAVGFAGYALYKLCWATLHPSYYQEIAELRDVLSYREELEEYAEKVDEPSEFVAEEFRESMTERYAKAADKNTDVNQNRSQWIYQSGYGLVGAVVFLILCVPPYVNHKLSQNDKQGEALWEMTEKTNRNRASLRNRPRPRTGKLDRMREQTSVER